MQVVEKQHLEKGNPFGGLKFSTNAPQTRGTQTVHTPILDGSARMNSAKK